MEDDNVIVIDSDTSFESTDGAIQTTTKSTYNESPKYSLKQITSTKSILTINRHSDHSSKHKKKKKSKVDFKRNKGLIGLKIVKTQSVFEIDEESIKKALKKTKGKEKRRDVIKEVSTAKVSNNSQEASVSNVLNTCNPVALFTQKDMTEQKSNPCDISDCKSKDKKQNIETDSFSACKSNTEITSPDKDKTNVVKDVQSTERQVSPNAPLTNTVIDTSTNDYNISSVNEEVNMKENKYTTEMNKLLTEHIEQEKTKNNSNITIISKKPDNHLTENTVVMEKMKNNSNTTKNNSGSLSPIFPCTTVPKKIYNTKRKHMPPSTFSITAPKDVVDDRFKPNKFSSPKNGKIDANRTLKQILGHIPYQIPQNLSSPGNGSVLRSPMPKTQNAPSSLISRIVETPEIATSDNNALHSIHSHDNTSASDVHFSSIDQSIPKTCSIASTFTTANNHLGRELRTVPHSSKDSNPQHSTVKNISKYRYKKPQFITEHHVTSTCGVHINVSMERQYLQQNMPTHVPMPQIMQTYYTLPSSLVRNNCATFTNSGYPPQNVNPHVTSPNYFEPFWPYLYSNLHLPPPPPPPPPTSPILSNQNAQKDKRDIKRVKNNGHSQKIVSSKIEMFQELEKEMMNIHQEYNVNNTHIENNKTNDAEKKSHAALKTGQHLVAPLNKLSDTHITTSSNVAKSHVECKNRMATDKIETSKKAMTTAVKDRNTVNFNSTKGSDMNLKRPICFSKMSVSAKKVKIHPISSPQLEKCATPRNVLPHSLKGYSPPILPIPSYSKEYGTLTSLNNKSENNYEKQVQNTQRMNPTNIKHSKANKPPKDASHCDIQEIGKKISLNEYKSRKLHEVINKISPYSDNVKNVARYSKEHRSDSRRSSDLDLGYDSDSTVIL